MTWFPLRLEYLDGWQALLLWLAAAVPVALLGWRRLDALGPVRQWVAISARLLVLALLVLVLAGARWERVNTKVETIVVRDVSASTQQVRLTGADDVEQAVEGYLRQAVRQGEAREDDDRIGVVSFDDQARVDLLPNTQIDLGGGVLREESTGTDVAAGINLALATLNRDAMHRLVLVWDGNQTQGDLDSAIEAAVSQGVPIDVMPLAYEVTNEVLVEDLIAPTSRRENEPFTVEVILRSENPAQVTGKLTVRHQNGALDMDPDEPGVQPTRRVALRPGRNVERVQVPAMPEAGVHQFRAVFEPDNLASELTGAEFDPTRAAATADTLLANNAASGFTFVRGKGQVLYVDAVDNGEGDRLAAALAAEGIDARQVGVEAFPNSLVELQRYDAVILANVTRGAGGLSEAQDQALAAYVHDMGGGLLMVGGEQAYGAGGWTGSKTAEILPVDLEVPAQRQLPKGALALIMHSCEMPNGNYWGEQCGIKAIEILNARDDLAILSYDWGGMGGGGVQFDYPLQPKGDGTRAVGALRGMQIGDMPDFDDALRKALNGDGTNPGLKDSDARQKHVIIISDGDPSPPAASVVQGYQAENISISTVSVYPHTPGQTLPQTMQDLAAATGGRAYGPVEANPNQLPQIFIKEATVVRRSLIQESNEGFPVQTNPSPSDLVAGIGNLPPVNGYMLTSRREDPQIETPFVVGDKNDPLLAFWQAGLGKVAAFTGAPTAKWSPQLVQSPLFNKFWAQLTRGVSRPSESSDFDVRTTVEGGKGRLVIEAYDRDNAFRNNLAFAGTVVGPDLEPIPVRPTQTAPGRYEAEFDAPAPGNYVVGLAFTGEEGGAGQLRGGTSVNGTPELRNLQSDFSAIQAVARRTGGRVLEPFEPQAAGLFARQWTGLDGETRELRRTSSFTPIWDLLIPVLIGLILLDVAIRRIAWDWLSTKQAAANTADNVRAYLLAGSRRGREEQKSLDALRATRQDSAARQAVAAGRPDPGRKYEPAAGRTIEGDLSSVIGGATNAPIPKDRPNAKPKADAGERPGEAGGMSSLMEAKRRARERIEKEREG